MGFFETTNPRGEARIVWLGNGVLCQRSLLSDQGGVGAYSRDQCVLCFISELRTLSGDCDAPVQCFYAVGRASGLWQRLSAKGLLAAPTQHRF